MKWEKFLQSELWSLSIDWKQKEYEFNDKEELGALAKAIEAIMEEVYFQDYKTLLLMMKQIIFFNYDQGEILDRKSVLCSEGEYKIVK